MSKIAEYIALLLFLIVVSSDAGFRFVQMLVQIVKGIERFMEILDPGYIKLWLPFIFLAAVAIVPIAGIWYELRQIRKTLE
jgi:hypothetical protein